MSGGHRYCLITPCRDESQFARRTLDSVTLQSIPPAMWIIVDDGSTDQTQAILAEYAAKFPYIRIMRRENRGFRKLGGGVIDTFYHGYADIDPKQFDFVCKLDLDLDLPPKYFEALMRRMDAEPRIGTASGKPYFVERDTGRKVMETCGDENSVGMVKFYRTACFDQIGGFVRELMWDGIDCHRCRMLGWIAVRGTTRSSTSFICGRWGPATRIGGPAGSGMGWDNISWGREFVTCLPARSVAWRIRRYWWDRWPSYGGISKA